MPSPPILDGKRDVIATLKCLGAPPSLAIAVYFVEILLLAALGIAIGLVIGTIIPFAAEAALQRLVPVSLAAVYPFELLLAAVYGLITALAFALCPLGRAREISPTALFRDQVAPAAARPRPGYLVAVACGIIALAALAIGFAFDRRIAVTFVIAAAGAFLLLRVVAAGIVALARRAAQPELGGAPPGARQHPSAGGADAVGGAVARARPHAADCARRSSTAISAAS